MMSTAERLNAIRPKLEEANRLRAQAEATKAMADQRVEELNKQIEALGVKPDKAEETLTKLEAQLTKELDAIEAALVKETAAYRAILEAGK